MNAPLTPLGKNPPRAAAERALKQPDVRLLVSHDRLRGGEDVARQRDLAAADGVSLAIAAIDGGQSVASGLSLVRIPALSSLDDIA